LGFSLKLIRNDGVACSSHAGGTIPKARFAAVLLDFPTFVNAMRHAFESISRGRGYRAVTWRSEIETGPGGSVSAYRIPPHEAPQNKKRARGSIIFCRYW